MAVKQRQRHRANVRRPDKGTPISRAQIVPTNYTVIASPVHAVDVQFNAPVTTGQNTAGITIGSLAVTFGTQPATDTVRLVVPVAPGTNQVSYNGNGQSLLGTAGGYVPPFTQS